MQPDMRKDMKGEIGIALNLILLRTPKNIKLCDFRHHLLNKVGYTVFLRMHIRPI